jgi:hypothetical protein
MQISLEESAPADLPGLSVWDEARPAVRAHASERLLGRLLFVLDHLHGLQRCGFMARKIQ